MSEQSQTLTFNLTCPESRAWLVLNSDHHEPRVLEMKQCSPNLWSASAELVPGEYRCRYYSGDEQTINYFGPADVDGGIESGMDTLVSVKIREQKSTSRLIPSPENLGSR